MPRTQAGTSSQDLSIQNNDETSNNKFLHDFGDQNNVKTNEKIIRKRTRQKDNTKQFRNILGFYRRCSITSKRISTKSLSNAEKTAESCASLSSENKYSAQNTSMFSDSVPSEKHTVATDYPIPNWLFRKKLLSKDYKCPYVYSKICMGKNGLINYDISGDINDSLVLCFHGLNASRFTFQDIQTACSKYKYCIITFDLYGHGLSANPRRKNFLKSQCHRSRSPKLYSLNFFIDQADDLLKHLNLEERHLSVVGFSMGGVIAAGFALRHYDLVDRLVLISSAGLLANRAPMFIKCLRQSDCCVPFSGLCVCGCCFRKKTFLKKFNKKDVENGLASSMWNRQIWQVFVKKGVIESFLGSVAGIPLWDAHKLFQKIGDIGIPVLLLWGQDDDVVPVVSARKIQSYLPNSHLIIFQNSSHLLIADKSHAIIALLLTFLEFPRVALLEDWKYLLPFSEDGNYVPKTVRAPIGMTNEQHLLYLNFRPRICVQLQRPIRA